MGSSDGGDRPEQPDVDSPAERLVYQVGLGRRLWDRFMEDPASLRYAMAIIVAVTMLTVVIGGIVIWIVDRSEFPDVWTGFWWALQTVTTVGYGDVVPKDPLGRTIGAVVMLASIALLSIITASITSIFVESRQFHRQQPRRAEEAAHRARLESRMDELLERLSAIERKLDAPPRA